MSQSNCFSDMKLPIVLIVCSFLAPPLAGYSQSGLTNSQPKRIVKFRNIGRDSINLHLDQNYFLIEDTCSSIIRYGHLKLPGTKFSGSFKDVSTKNPEIVVAEGKYAADGTLDGEFISRFFDGKLQAKGTFENGKMIGKWVVYFPDDRPRLTFESSGGITKILDAWSENGKQQVTGGKGNFRADLADSYWEGRLENGTPDGTWKFYIKSNRAGTPFATETFRDGKFVKGTGPAGTYHEVSRITLTDPGMLPVYNIQSMRVSPENCDGDKLVRKVSYAFYRNGSQAFTDEIFRVVKPVFAAANLQTVLVKEFKVVGIIDETGKIGTLKYKDHFDEKMSSSLLQALNRLPFLNATQVDGIAVSSNIEFYFKIDNNNWYTRWKILPLSK